jgi:hypothetical protein
VIYELSSPSVILVKGGLVVASEESRLCRSHAGSKAGSFKTFVTNCHADSYSTPGRVCAIAT